MIAWPWRKRPTGPPSETTEDRRKLIAEQKRKLRQAERFVSGLRAHDRQNHYAERLRLTYVRELAKEAQ